MTSVPLRKAHDHSSCSCPRAKCFRAWSCQGTLTRQFTRLRRRRRETGHNNPCLRAEQVNGRQNTWGRFSVLLRHHHSAGQQDNRYLLCNCEEICDEAIRTQRTVPRVFSLEDLLSYNKDSDEWFCRTGTVSDTRTPPLRMPAAGCV